MNDAYPQQHPLDHLVLGVPDLDEGADRFEKLTGLTPAFGGRYATGTANYLVALGDGAYLEITGILAEERGNGLRQPFQLEGLTRPRLTTWCLTSRDISATLSQARAGDVDLGEAVSLSRTNPAGELLSWQMTVRTPMAEGGTQPFVIDWGDTPHPSTRDLPSAELTKLSLSHPDPPLMRRHLSVLGVGSDLVAVVRGPYGLAASIETPRGLVVIT